MKLVPLFLFALSMISSPWVHAQATDSKGQWIWQAQDGPTNGWVAFRKSFDLAEVPSEAVASIATDTKHWLWINGKLVRSEGGRAGAPSMARPWTRTQPVHEQPAAEKPRNTWVQQISLAEHLREGENLIAVLVWHWGRETHKGYHIDSGQGGLFFELDLPGGPLVSGPDWKALQHPAYDPEAGERDNSVVGFDVGFDANKSLGDWTDQSWTTRNFDSSHWPQAVAKGLPPTAPWHELVVDDIAPLLDHGLQNYVHLGEDHRDRTFPFVSDGTPIRARLPFNRQITPYFEIEFPAGGEQVSITTDNRLNRVEALYTARPGKQAFESYSWMNGHEVIYTIPAGATVHALKHRWQSVGEVEGTLSISDPDLQRLWDMGVNTLTVCARDNFMDCPDRERALWIGDVADQASYLFYVMGPDGRALLRRAIESTFLFAEDGSYGALGPLRIRELPSQSLQFVFQGVWEYYLNTGDRETLAFSLPPIHAYLAKWDMDENGLPAYSRGFSPDRWDWVDWGEKETHDKPIIQVSLYYAALDAARKMADVLGDQDKSRWCVDRMQRIEGAFDEAFWAGDHYSSSPGEFKDDRANALAILCGLAGPERFDPVVENVLIPNRFSSPHLEWMVNLAMAKAGHTQAALERMVDRYRPQIDRTDLTTLFENFPARGSYNHAWNAPNAVIARAVVGIVPVEAGWKRFAVSPELLHIDKLHQSFSSVAGDISVKWERTDAGVTFELTVPGGSTAHFNAPRHASGTPAESISLNGAPAWASDTGSVHERVMEETADRVSFELPAGTWTLVVQ